VYQRNSNSYKRRNPRIPFSDLFPKLRDLEVGRVLTTIRFIDKYDYYKELEDRGAEVDLYLSTSEQVLARCRILGIAVVTIYDLDEKMVRADTYQHWTLLELRTLLTKFYQGKPEWKGKNSRFIVLFLLPTEKLFHTDWQPTWTGGSDPGQETLI